jgi:hypothetical protein
MIEGGYYIKARKIQESEIAFCPPHVREIWDWFMLKANHTERNGIKRGSLFTSISDIREGLKWFVGYRKEMYSKSKCEMSMNWLRKRGMITTMKTTRGMIITICNYDTYQNPENYENNNDKCTKPTRNQQTHDTIHKNDKELKEINNIPPSLNFVKNYCLERKNNVDAEKWYNFYEAKGWMIGKNKMKDWKAAVRTWEGDVKLKNTELNYKEMCKLVEKEGRGIWDEYKTVTLSNGKKGWVKK